MRFLAAALVGLVASSAVASEVPAPAFAAQVAPIPPAIATKMTGHSWHEGCPVAIADLRYVTLSFWGYDGEVHNGELVIAATLADEVVTIFRELFQAHFPIERMRLVDDYGGDDKVAMADNNTSGFNCRNKSGMPDEFSQHGWGRAIDINPLVNPLVSKNRVEPPAAKAHVDRALQAKGILVWGDAAVTAFRRHGWQWGGAWTRMKDYQHFEKKSP